MTEATGQAQQRPMLSVIVPTRDRPAALRACLESIVTQPGAADTLEVIVVDDGGAIPASEATGGFGPRLGLRHHRQENAGPAAARNAGARLATGDWLVFLDDDCCPEPGWLEALVARCRRHPEAMLGGSVRNALTGDPYAICHQLLLDYLYHRLNPTPATAAFCASSNLAVPAHAFRAVGGFDPGFPYPAAEDRDLCDRWRRSGRELVHTAEVRVLHTHEMNVRLFWRQHFRYGRGARRLHRLRSLRDPACRAREASRFYLDLLMHPLRRTESRRSLDTFLLVVLSQLATACGYAAEALANRSQPMLEDRCFS